MKKTYIKPQIMFESFTLSTNIAGDCEVKTNTPNSGTCAYEVSAGAYGTWNVFIDTVQACTTVPADGQYDGFCYHTPTETNNLFNS